MSMSIRFAGIDATTGRPVNAPPTPAEQAKIKEAALKNLPAQLAKLAQVQASQTQNARTLAEVASDLAPLTEDHFAKMQKAYEEGPVCFGLPPQ